MTRDDLEAVVWRHWPARGPKAGDAVDAILAAADAYKNGDTTETRAEALLREQRRAVLDGRILHYIPLDDDAGGFACHPQGNATATTSLTEVTCRKCLRTDAYRQDLAVSA